MASHKLVQFSKRCLRWQAPKAAWKLVLFQNYRIGEIPRDSVVIRDSGEIWIFESLWSNTSGLGIVARLKGLKIDIVPIVHVKFDSDVSRKIEIRV